MATRRPPTKQAAYKLPVGLIRDIRRAAAEGDVYPAKIVERACRVYVDNVLCDAARRERASA